jgi:phosphoglycolate phosphatase
MNQVIHKLNLVEGMAEVLEELKAQGYTLGIVTSNGRENVKTFLRNHRLDYQFEFIESELNLWGKSRGIKRLIKKRGWPLEAVAYVGDEVRDIQAAHQIGIKAIAVGWGFQLPEILSEYQPDFLLSEPRELLEVVQKLKNP